MKIPLLLLLLLPSPLLSPPPPTCPRSCGPTKIPFPFGLSPNCSLPGFLLSCHHHRHLLLPPTNLRILRIFNGQLRFLSSPFIASHCPHLPPIPSLLSLPPSAPFTISALSNRFVSLGCDTAALISDDNTFASACVSLCPAAACYAPLPYGRRRVSLAVRSAVFGHANVCGYAFLAEDDGYEFGAGDLRGFEKRGDLYARLDWAVGDGEGCSGGGGFLCGENGYCVAAPRGSGYLCNCLQGFEGNAYLNGSDGCRGKN